MHIFLEGYRVKDKNSGDKHSLNLSLLACDPQLPQFCLNVNGDIKTTYIVIILGGLNELLQENHLVGRRLRAGG